MGLAVSSERALAPAGLVAAEVDARWFASHPDIVRSHAGKWICIPDGRLVAADEDDRIFEEKVREYSNRDGVYIVRVPTSEELDAAGVP
jgi:hypothetical protein